MKTFNCKRFFWYTLYDRRQIGDVKAVNVFQTGYMKIKFKRDRMQLREKRTTKTALSENKLHVSAVWVQHIQTGAMISLRIQYTFASHALYAQIHHTHENHLQYSNLYVLIQVVSPTNPVLLGLSQDSIPLFHSKHWHNVKKTKQNTDLCSENHL